MGERGHLTTIELRPEFAKVAQANATLYYGEAPSWWDLKTGDFDSVAAELPEHWFDRIMLDMLDPWNRLEQAYRVIAPRRRVGQLRNYHHADEPHGRSPARGRLLDRAADPGIVRTHMEGPGPRRTPRPPDDRSYRFPCYLARMASGFEALRKRDRVTKDTQTDIDSLTDEQREAQIEELELRDISDHKLRKVLRDLDRQVGELGNTHE